MALPTQVVPVNFGVGGVDTKTDPKAVIPGKWLRLENAVLTSPNRAEKRNGYTAANSTIASVGTLSAPKMVHGFKDEMIAADQDMLLAYSSNQTAWINRGPYISTELTKNSVDQAHPASGYVDCAISGNYAVYGWSTAVQSSATYGTVASKNYGSVVDLTTGTVLVGPQLLATKSGTGILNVIKCVVLGSNTLAVVYLNAGATALVMRIVSFPGSGVVSFGSELTVTTNLNASSFWFDIVTTSTGASLAYFSTTGVTIANINTAGTVTASVNIVDGNAFGPISINLNNSNLWVYWCQAAGGPPIGSNVIVYRVYSTALALVLTTTNVATQAAPYYVSNFTPVATSATSQTLYYGKYVTTYPAATGFYTDVTYSVTNTSAGVVGADTFFANGVTPYSKAFTDSSTNYAVFLYRSANLVVGGTFEAPQSQPTYFVLKLGTESIPVCAARFGYGLANNQNTLQDVIGYQPTVCTISSRKYLVGLALETQDQTGNFFTTSSLSTSGGATGAFSYIVDFNSAESYQAVNAGEIAILNGGLLQAYDGQQACEWGYHLAPEIPRLVASNGSGSLSNNGVYSYIAVYVWVDAQGNLHQSAPSLPKSITLGAADDTVAMTVSTAYLSKKSNVGIAIYRTTNGGSVYYLINNPLFPINAVPDSTGGTATTWTDLLSDNDIDGNALAYTYPGSPVLENGTPPPAMLLLPHNNRLFFADSENRNTYWYTKSYQPGNGLSPSPFLTNAIDPKYGEISGLGEMDEKLVIGKEKGFIVQAGDGANDTGTGSTFSFPQIVPSDVGITSQKSVILTPKGLMFKSANGIYMLDRALNVSYVGAEVEDYNAQTITGATLVPGKSQIRFLCSTGLTLVYDYIFNQWATFTNHTGVSSSTWNNSYVYSTGSAIFLETASTYTDNGTAFSWLAQTSWLAFAGIQGFQRVRRVIALGDYANGGSASHALSIQAAYDFSTTFQSAVSYQFGAASSSGVFQYRERLPIQKCDSVSLLIQETTTGSGAEYVDLTNLSFEVAVKRGVNKLPATRSVG